MCISSAISIPSSRFHSFPFIFIHFHISPLSHFHFHFHFQYTPRSDINQRKRRNRLPIGSLHVSISSIFSFLFSFFSIFYSRYDQSINQSITSHIVLSAEKDYMALQKKIMCLAEKDYKTIPLSLTCPDPRLICRLLARRAKLLDGKLFFLF